MPRSLSQAKMDRWIDAVCLLPSTSRYWSVGGKLAVVLPSADKCVNKWQQDAERCLRHVLRLLILRGPCNDLVKSSYHSFQKLSFARSETDVGFSTPHLRYLHLWCCCQATQRTNSGKPAAQWMVNDGKCYQAMRHFSWCSSWRTNTHSIGPFTVTARWVLSPRNCCVEGRRFVFLLTVNTNTTGMTRKSANDSVRNAAIIQ
jgi:hypothetical protein